MCCDDAFAHDDATLEIPDTEIRVLSVHPWPSVVFNSVWFSKDINVSGPFFSTVTAPTSAERMMAARKATAAVILPSNFLG